MAAGRSADADEIGREIVTSRIFNHPRSLVWRAWTEPDHLANWWGPNGFTNTFHEFDLRPQGEWKFVMHGPDGTDYKNLSHFIEITEPERLVFDHVSGHFFIATAEFEAVGENRTRVTYQMLHPTVEACEEVKGFVGDANEQLFDRLGAELDQMAWTDPLPIRRRTR